MLDKNAGAANDYYIRNKYQKSAVPKPVAESHRLAGNLDALGMRVIHKSGVDYQFLILIKHKLNHYFTILLEITKLRRLPPRFQTRSLSSSKAEGYNRPKDD